MAEVRDAPKTPEEVFNYAKAAGQAQASSVQTKLQIAGLMDKINAATNDATGAIAGGALADQQISGIKNAFEAQVDAKKAAVIEASNTDPTVAGNRITQYLREMNDNADKASAAADIVHSKQSLNILSDPIGFISAQFTMPTDVETYNYYAGKHNAAEASLSGLLATTTAAGANINMMKQATSAALASAESDKIAQAANANIAKISIDNLQTNIKGAEILNNITTQQLDMVVKGEQLKISQQHLAIAAATLQETIKDRAARTAERAEALSDKNEAKAEKGLYALQYNIAAKAKGLPELPELVIIAGLKRGNKSMESLVNYGQAIQANGNSQTGVPIAGTAGEAAVVLATSNARPVGSSAPVTAFLKESYDAVKGNPLNAGTKDQAVLAEKTNVYIKAKADELQLAVKSGDASNIYSIPPSAAIASMPALKASTSEFVQKVLLPTISVNPNVDIKPVDIISSGVSTLTTNPKALEDVVKGINQYYTQGVLANNLTKGITEAGLPKQTGYNAVMPLGLFGGNLTVDLTSPVAVKSLLMRRLMITQDLNRTGSK